MFDGFKGDKIIKNKIKISNNINNINEKKEKDYNKDFDILSDKDNDGDNSNNDKVNIINDNNNVFSLKNINNKNNDNNNIFEDENYSDNNNNTSKKKDNVQNNSNIINKKNDNEISQILKEKNKLLLSPKALYSNNNNNYANIILKPLNIHTAKKQKPPSSAFPTPYNQRNNLIEKNLKTYHKVNQINTPSSLANKNIIGNKLFNNNDNESNFSKIRTKKTIKEEKKNRNKSLVDIINNNYHHNEIEENNLINNQDDFHNLKTKKYSRHFGKEENCPICVALQMKNKFLEEKNKNILPILTKHNINKSPNKNNLCNNNNIKDKMRRIMSSRPDRIKKMKRTESVKEMRKINNDNFFEVLDLNERFPALNEYINLNKYN